MSEELCANFSQKVQEVAKAPKYRGAIFQIEADEKGLALVDVKEASLKVYLMIDPECDKILETRFFTYGGPIFTALADTFCKKIQMVTVEEACAITAESIERELRDTPDMPAFDATVPELKQMNTLIRRVQEAYPEKKATAILVREKMERIENCQECRSCASKCPYGLDTPSLLKYMLKDWREFYEEHKAEL